MYIKPLLKSSAVLAVSASLMINSVALAAPSPVIGSGTTTITAQNMNVSTDSTVVVSFFTEAGAKTGTDVSRVLHTGLSTDVTPTDAGLGAGFKGSAILSSDQDTAAIGYTLYQTTAGQAGGPADGITSGIYEGVPSASSQLVFLLMVYSKNGTSPVQNTIATVQNTSSSQADLTLNWIDRNNVVTTRTDTLPGYGSKSYDMSKYDQSDLQVPDFSTLSGWTGNAWSGSLVVTSTQSVIVGSAINSRPDFVGSYNALSGGSSTWYLPTISRRETNIPGDGIGECNPTTGQFVANKSLASDTSIINVVNLDPVSRNITVTLQGASSGMESKVVTATLSAGQAIAVATRTGAGGASGDRLDCRLFATLAPLSAGKRTWVGSGVVSSDGNVVANVLNLRRAISGSTTVPTTGSFYSGVSSSDAGTKAFLPGVYRKGSVATGSFGTMSKWNLVRIQNMGTTTATVTLNYYNQSSTTAVMTVNNLQIGPGTSGAYNLLSACYESGVVADCASEFSAATSSGSLSTNFTGSLVATSNQPIAAVADVLYRNSSDPVGTNNSQEQDSYNGRSSN